MRIRRDQVFTVIYLYICFLQTVVAYFGLAARKHILISNLGLQSTMVGNKREEQSANELCGLLLLQGKQKKMCQRDKGVANTLLEATSLSTMECEHQFKRERWNCTLSDQYRLNLLKKGFKETSFLYAISSASLVHTFSRSCSRGSIDRCTCDESKNLENNREAWLWGGCGDNIKFGLKFSRRFLRAGKRRGKDIRAKVDQHNIRLGRKVVKSAVRKHCKCHGISGSCTVKTCWRQLSTFLSVGSALKHKYEHSYKVVTYTNQATGKSPLSDELILENDFGNIVRSRKSRTSVSDNSSKRDKTSKRSGRDRHSKSKDDDELTPSSNVMVHLEDSPTFCEPTLYSPGTNGRTCDHSNCDVMCCGGGYNIRSVNVTRACQCQVHWCCYVECKTCVNKEEVFLCK